ncbi:MAG: cytochrome c3 family protein [Deltaproteobacteria bacterium]|nr:cytochrome c3 family protein [Deltaproteobacteria bacterium]
MGAFVNGSAGLCLAVLALACSDGEVTQPIPFNHNIHVSKNGLACEDCHEQVFTGPSAGLPRVSVCMGCHDSDITTSQAAAPHIETIRRHSKEGTEIPWVNLYTLPHHVYYSHRRHAKIAGIACATCHGDIGKSETPPRLPIERTLDMWNCIDCHRERGVDNDCAWCHR